MDTTRDISFRSYLLNDHNIEANVSGGGGTGAGIHGCVVDTFDFTDVDVVQWMEKRSQADGSDAGDASLGPRRIRIAGTLYAPTRPLLFDELFDLRAALNPVLSQREEPLDKGYRPLYFSVPTSRLTDYPSGVIDLMTRALPRGIQHVTQRDSLGGVDDDALAIPWQATFICKDPSIYSADPVTVDINVASAPVTQAGQWTNRGTYLGKFNGLFVVNATAGSIAVTVGDSVFTISVPSSTGTRTIRVKDDKLITFEESEVESLQMSKITFTGDTTWPMMVHGPTDYSVTFTGCSPQAGGRIWFYEQYA
jgi:hypothetical protein